MKSEHSAEPGHLQKDISEIFPLAGYFMKHFFQTIGIAIPVIGGAGYAIGKSYFDGWDAAGGLRATLFPMEAYVLILQGLKLQTPWYWAIGSICMVVAFIRLRRYSKPSMIGANLAPDVDKPSCAPNKKGLGAISTPLAAASAA